jgi:alpha-N-acetylglucosamine transferase
MPVDDYWEDDELQDRLFYAREHEHERLGQRHLLSSYRIFWPSRRLKVAPVIFFVLVLSVWWWMRSGQNSTKLDWSRYAYSQYTTDTQSLCNALMVFESLHRLRSKADRILLYPQEWAQNQEDINWSLIRLAEQKFGVISQPIHLLTADGNPESPGTLENPSDWNLSITKIRVFDLVQYDRVLHLDSDITLLQHMDELFLLPKTPIAMPRAYWSDGPPFSWPLTSHIMLIEPNSHEVPAMMDLLKQWKRHSANANSKNYDMDLLNLRFGASAMVLPHRSYAMLTAEFRSHNHTAYLGHQYGHKLDSRGQWDPDKALKEAKMVHFSDWPLPKPWIMWPVEGLAEIQPDCGNDHKETCREREIWKTLYDDFRLRRKNLCKILSVPAPDWLAWKNMTGAGSSRLS